MQYHGWWNSATARVALCNRIGSTERAASSAYHGIGAWGERRQLTSWPSRYTALLFYCLPPHLPTSQAADTRHYQALSAVQVLRNKMEPGFTCWPQSLALFSFALKLQNSSSRWFLFSSLGFIMSQHKSLQESSGDLGIGLQAVSS